MMATSCCPPLGTVGLSDDQAEATARVFRALADPNRIKIVNLLATSRDPVCVCELTAPLGLSHPPSATTSKRSSRPGIAWAMRYWAMPVRTVIERGPEGKRSVAFGLDWPGWSRGAKSAELALETLESYRERYRPIPDLAGMAREFDTAGPLEVVEDRVGTGSTDFWGISFSPSSTEQGPMGEAELERGITLLRACWEYFDGVAARVSPELRKGPRGGGRDRDRIIRHTIRTESEDFAKQVGLRIPEEAALTPDGLRQHREAYVAAMRAYNAGEVKRRMRSWTLPFLIRHSAYHTLDHAWEMEDKDLTPTTQDGA